MNDFEVRVKDFKTKGTLLTEGDLEDFSYENDTEIRQLREEISDLSRMCIENNCPQFSQVVYSYIISLKGYIECIEDTYRGLQCETEKILIQNAYEYGKRTIENLIALFVGESF